MGRLRVFQSIKGSPPRMRGASMLEARHWSGARITPAHAGSICKSHPTPSNLRDHPRACGEHVGSTWVYVPTLGSPPRMRGASGRTPKVSNWNRITPAHAGSIPTQRAIGCRQRDHPRACGEHSCSLPNTPMTLGSPPRMRGAWNVVAGATQDCGITPAHAGSMQRSSACNRSA